MTRIRPLTPKEAGWFARFIYWASRRKIGRVLTPTQVVAHHPRMLAGVVGMESAMMAAKTVPPTLKTLASIKAAMMIGCPF
jgi:hypothetical protein